jgi:transcriptional regulator with XRE-family HTH domain
MKREWLIKYRISKHMTQDQLALKTGLSQSYISSIENGTRGKRMLPYAAKKWAKVLGFDWTKFYE